MTQRQRLVYVSKATFASVNRLAIIEPEIGRILMRSRRNDPARGLVGALYYGDGNFFRVRQAIDQLLETLRMDAIHGDLVVSARSPIEQTSFDAWSMKYVAASREMKRLLTSFGHERFATRTASAQSGRVHACSVRQRRSSR